MVTERKTSGDADRADLADRLRLATRAGAIGEWQWDVVTNTLTWDRQMFHLYGVAPETAIPCDDILRSAIRIGHGERVQEALADAVAGRCDYDIEFPIQTQAGDNRAIGAQASVIRDQSGRALRMIGVSWDVTAASRLSEVRHQQNRFRAAVDAVQGVLWTNDAEGRMVGEQPGWAALTGQKFADYQGYGWADAVHPDDVAPSVDSWNLAVSERRTYVFEHRVRRHDGAWRLFAIRAVPLLDPIDDSILEWVGVHTDITERRAAETELRATNLELEQAADEFRTLAEGMPELCWMARPDGAIYWYNQHWYRYTGTVAADMEGWGWQSVHDPVRLPEVLDRWRASIACGQPFEMTFPLRGADGVLRPFLTRVAPVYDHDGNVRRWLGINIDMSEIQAMNLELENRVQARTAELREMARQLEQDVVEIDLARRQADAATAAKAAFLANMSHEIRTPMNGVLGFSELLLDTPLDPEQRRHVSLINESAQALLKLLNDILDVSKLDAGQLDVVAEPFNLPHGIKQCLRLMSPMAERKGPLVHANIAADFPRMVLTDGLRLRQILLNLLGNAVKFTSIGSVVVDLQRTVAVDGRPMLTVSVADTGVGIEQGRLDAVFESFVQADQSISRRYGGSGLGLTISRRLAELMHGTIDLERRSGGGTIATLTLPLVEAELTQALLSAVDQPARSGPEKHGASVLVVEDVDINRELITAMLGRMGHRVEIAENGAIALAKAARLREEPGSWDLILMDVQMPVMDGVTATRAIRALGGRAATIPIVAISASAFADEVQECRDAGMNDHIAKPIMTAKLLEIIDRWANPAPDGRIAFQEADLTDQALGERFKLRCEKYAARLAEIQVAMTSADAATMQELSREAIMLAHSIAGSAGMFGEAGLGKLGTEIEREIEAARGSGHDVAVIGPSLARLAGALAKAA